MNIEELIESLRNECIEINGGISQKDWRKVCVKAIEKVFEATKKACIERQEIEYIEYFGIEIPFNMEMIEEIKFEDLNLD